MATQLPRTARPPQRAPIIEQLATELMKTDGSLTSVAHGTVYRAGSAVPWEMHKEWHGRELSSYSWRTSKWTKNIVVHFYVGLNTEPAKVFAFALHLKPPLTDADIAQMAETYMTVLNMRRVD